MAKKNEVYKCAVCGNVVEVLVAGAGALSCCGQPMKLLKENTNDGAKEKHVPVVEKIPGGYRVSVGSDEHPMTEAHYIEWVSLQTKFGNQRKALKPGDRPTVCFALCEGDEVEAVYAYCNLHSLWKG